ncbi:BZ3500_MvSof-1268-A1-R1_Chr7-1g09456 [Microbotryum saponariae]|uniref:BZ3500_MvSof-1268-A1-R1_Chr7-1g09456 protein n=1 Tax=Microbotryum saponariae TaxID=289078 RepID=A0A2X0LVU7_9BASI|nr:BZ3501_MvSof-1269-A2-R1_Chr7-1g09161 [Microbotryum saponariae]SDA03483.1 BZ3500_MvSof-1268-A1-R1_Chr7-1g09456 [Microbotryum saponariae]
MAYREGIPERLRLDKLASPESSAVRSRPSSPHTSSISTPTTAAFNVLTPGSTPKASTIPHPPLAPEQAAAPPDPTAETGGALAESTSQRDLNAARAALADVHLTKANTDPEHYGRHAESSSSTSSQPGNLVISIDAARAVSLSASASSSRNASPTAPKPPTFPRRHSGSQTSLSSRRSSNASIPHETARRLSTSSAHLLSPRAAGESAGWTPTDVQHSPVTEGVVDLSSSTNQSALSTSASTSSLKFELIVRDFAYPSDDPRFKGLPHPDEVNDKRDSSSRASRMSGLNSPAFGNDAFGASSSSACELDGYCRVRRTAPWTLALTEPSIPLPVSWGFVTSHATDFNTSEDDSQLYSEDDASSRSDFDYADAHSAELKLGEFVPGIYSAMYDFAPELDTEMSISTGELVTVFSRQCAGWVQAARVGQDGNVTGEMGLVPENYLALIEEGEFVTSETPMMTGVGVGDEVEYHDETPSANEVNPYEEEREDMDESANGPRRGGEALNDEDGSKVSMSATPTSDPRTEA